MNPAIGSDIAAYRIEAVLGRGGMGVVYRATDSRLGRKVALKVLPPEYGDDETFRARFLRESRVAASIDHPGVIPIYEAGEADGQLYIAMRYVEGTDLAELLRSEGALEPVRALALVGQLAAALDAAHARGLVHRDVKPSNALVTRVGDADHVYLCDFGLSKDTATDPTLSAPGGVIGTVRYMAPEVIRSGEATAGSDLYSLGCVLFECLTGEASFAGTNQAVVIYGHLEQPPPRVSERRPELPRGLDDVLARALHKDPDQRWATGAELMRAAHSACAGGEPALPRPRRRRVLVATLGLLALVAAAVGIRIADSDDSAALASVKPNGVAVIDPDGDSLTGQVAFDGAPGAIADGAGAVWVTDPDRDVVARVDKETLTIRQTIPVGNEPAAIAAGRDAVWVTNRQDGTVSRISPQTNEVVDRIRVGRSADGVCLGGDAVWVATDYAVVRLNTATGRRAGIVRLDGQPADLACGSGVVWASSPTAGTVTEISAAATVAVRTIEAGRGVSGLGIGAGGVWVANALGGTVSRIDPERGAITATVPVGAAESPARVAVTKDAVWVSSEFGGTLARIDPQRPQVVEKLRVGNRPQGLAVVDGALWLGVADTGERHRGGTLRIPLPEQLAWLDLDPSTVYSPEGFELLGVMHDGLTAFPRTAEGLTLVPNLAEGLPSPTDGGRTYTFRLRDGVEYSTGEPVRASHLRFGVERAVRHHPAGKLLFGSIRGVGACTPQRCDLSEGIVTDDAEGTVVFRLSEPDGDLLYKLAAPYTAPLPPSVGSDAPAKRPLPSTGPYRIAAFEPGKTLRLERNPRFESWSVVARPDGFADVISARPSDGPGDTASIDDVLSGRADRAGVGLQVPPDRLAGLRRQVPGQLRASVVPNTFYFVLNVRRPPFDRLDARRAVAFAFDRREAVARAGGPDHAQETCQLLPPSYQGSRPSCPFTVPGTGGARGRPDLAEARRLVRRSGTRGMRVTVKVPTGVAPGLGRQMTRTLREIGYDASLRSLSQEEHFSTLGDGKRTQIALNGWIADHPAPSTFLGNFTCDANSRDTDFTLNPSHFCDRQADRLMERARRLQPTQPVTADELWARAQRRIIDRVPAVPVYNLVFSDVVSARLGNYRFNPITGMLLDQAWVR